MNHHEENNNAELAQRLARLESQAAFQEDNISQMHELVYAQQKELFKLQRQVEQLKNKTADSSAGQENLRHEKPPHY